jgi:polysaccharide pyruvyl transferase CsaB
MDPARTTEIHGLPAVHRYRAADVIGSMRNADLVISGGGSLLQDVTSARSILYYLGIIRLARSLRRKVMVYAQGIGPINGRLNRMLTRCSLNGIAAVTVRDEESRDRLIEMLVRHPEIQVSADPSFAVEPAAPAEVSELLASFGVDPELDKLGISLRPWFGQERWLPEVAVGIRDAVTQLGVQPVFLPMQPTLDRDVTLRAAESVQRLSTVLPEMQSPAQAKAITGQMGLVVSMRLHTLIFAASMGIPGLALSYDPKVANFARSAGIAALDLTDLTASDLKQAILGSWERRRELGETAGRRAAEMKGLALQSADIACKLIS